MDDIKDIIRTLIGSSQNVALLISPSASDHEFLLKEALKSSLERAGKSVISLPEDSALRRQRWAGLIKPSSRLYPEKVFIRVGKKASVEEITENGQSVFVLSSPETIQLEEISIGRGLAAPDAAIAFFENSQSLQALGLSIPLPSADKIVFLGAKTRTLTEKTADIAKIVAGDIREEANLLLAALLSETNMLGNAGSGVFALAKELLEAGASIERIRQMVRPSLTQGTMQLFGRALARSFKDEGSHVLWAFLSLKDFERTHMPPDRFTAAMVQERLSHEAEDAALFLFLLLWEDREKKVWGRALSRDSARLKRLQERYGALSSNGSFFFGPFPSFSAAEIELKAVIKSAEPAFNSIPPDSFGSSSM